MGSNEYGQLGTSAPVRTQTDVRFRDLGRGQASGNLCAISQEGHLYCWGIGGDGQGGNGTIEVAPVPTRVASSLTFRETGSGQDFACALADSGDAWCWGRNEYGKLGTGVAGGTTVPALVAGGLSYSALAVGGQHACAIDSADDAWCWGMNGAGPRLDFGEVRNSIGRWNGDLRPDPLGSPAVLGTELLRPTRFRPRRSLTRTYSRTNIAA